jgi:hypothetical protein
MQAVIKGPKLIIRNGKGEIVLSVLNKGKGNYKLLAPEGKALEIEGEVLYSTGSMYYTPGSTIGLHTVKGFSMRLCDPKEADHTEVG